MYGSSGKILDIVWVSDNECAVLVTGYLQNEYHLNVNTYRSFDFLGMTLFKAGTTLQIQGGSFKGFYKAHNSYETPLGEYYRMRVFSDDNLIIWGVSMDKTVSDCRIDEKTPNVFPTTVNIDGVDYEFYVWYVAGDASLENPEITLPQ
jgi:hypothetical protein